MMRYLIILFFISLPNANAIQCKKAKEKWEHRVCSSEKLLSLDKKLNAEYKKCFDRYDDTVYESQKEWLKSLSALSLADLEDGVLLGEYEERIYRLRFCNLSAKYSYQTPVPGDNKKYPLADRRDKSNLVPYVWAVLKLDGRTIIRYPKLLESSRINDNINKTIYQYGLEHAAANLAFVCEKLPEDINFNVTINSDDFFGIHYETTSRECNPQADYQEIVIDALWDLKTGKDLLAYNSYPGIDPRDVNEKNLAERKTSILHPAFIKYLPRFVNAGLISEATAAKIVDMASSSHHT